MKRKMIYNLSLCLLSLCICLIAEAGPQFSITNYKEISSKGGRTSNIWKLALTASITNSGSDAENVKAFLSVNDPNIKIIKNFLDFGLVRGNSTVSTSDAFIVETDHNFPIDTNAFTWSFFFLPPDPGEAGKQTLLGIDSDNDGVRDDIQRYIHFTYSNEKKVRLALAQIARDFQRLLPDAADPDLALENVKKLNNSRACLSYIKGGARIAMKLDFALTAEILNTKARSFTYISFNNSLAGKTTTLPPLEEHKNCCLFDVDNVGGN